jgi:hypothetical protein
VEAEARPELIELEQVRREIELWRRDRLKLGEMPAPLWEGATSIARKLGIYRASKTLKLNYGALKQRVMPLPRRRRTQRRRKSKVGAAPFLELSGVSLFKPTRNEGGIIEVVAADGARLIIRLSSTPFDVGALVSGFHQR